jgi:imidazolonepropionase-like amidohydrolase
MKQLRNWLVLAVLIFCTVASATRAQQSQPTPPPILVKASRLLDPRTGNVLSPAAVLIEGGKIKEVGAPAQVQAQVPAGARIIDLGTATLLPGLLAG